MADIFGWYWGFVSEEPTSNGSSHRWGTKALTHGPGKRKRAKRRRR